MTSASQWACVPSAGFFVFSHLCFACVSCVGCVLRMQDNSPCGPGPLSGTGRHSPNNLLRWLQQHRKSPAIERNSGGGEPRRCPQTRQRVAESAGGCQGEPYVHARRGGNNINTSVNNTRSNTKGRVPRWPGADHRLLEVGQRLTRLTKGQRCLAFCQQDVGCLLVVRVQRTNYHSKM